jgi:hypothetical protein
MVKVSHVELFVISYSDAEQDPGFDSNSSDTHQVMTRHDVVRDEARRNLSYNTQVINQLLQRRNKQHTLAIEQNDIVLVGVPRIDRASSDPLSLPCKVLAITSFSWAASLVSCKSHMKLPNFTCVRHVTFLNSMTFQKDISRYGRLL